MVEKNYLEGAAQRAGGKLEEAAGYVAGDPGARFGGRMRQMAGKAQQAYGRAAEELWRNTRNRPLPALLAAVAIGFVLGRIWARQ